MPAAHHPSLLDPKARAVVDRLHALARKQMRALLPHYLPRVFSMMLGRPVKVPTDTHLFDDKLLPIDPPQGDLLYCSPARAAPAVPSNSAPPSACRRSISLPPCATRARAGR